MQFDSDTLLILEHFTTVLHNLQVIHVLHFLNEQIT